MNKPQRGGFGKQTHSSAKPKTVEAQEAHAEQLIQAGQRQAAASIYKQLIRNNTCSDQTLKNLAAILELEGDHNGALLLLQQALSMNPNSPEIHYNLANQLKTRKDLKAAIHHYQQAIQLRPSYHEAITNLGISLSLTGDHQAAVETLKNAQNLKPSDPYSHYNLGKALQHSKQFARASEAYKQAIEAQPDNPSFHNNLGVCLQEQGLLKEAIAAFKTAINHQPQNARVHYNLGNALHRNGSTEHSITSFQIALKLAPNNSTILNNLGIAQQESGNLEAAITSFQAAIQLQPSQAETHFNLGTAQKLNHNTEAATRCFKTALDCNKNHTGSLNNLGNILQEQDNLTDAIECFKRAITIESNNPEFHYNLANTFKLNGELNHAIEHYQKALQLRSDHAETHFNLSLALLLNGDYRQGWIEYSWRDKTGDAPAPHATPACRRWDSQMPLNNEPLLLISEQGLGDTLQFMRYVPVLRDQGVAIRFCAQEKLHPLIQSSGIDPQPLTRAQANNISEGVWLPLLSLPAHLGVSPAKPLATAAYLHAEPERVQHWAHVMENLPRPLIGLNWQGNPAAELGSLRGRSAPLESLAAIAATCPGSLISLQAGTGVEQLEQCTFRHRFCAIQNQLSAATDLSDTAAIAANCDLVITTDTAMAHLAAGMGVPTWILLHQPPEWRWGISGSNSFWYPSARLFRQSQRHDWTSLAEQVAMELRKSSELLKRSAMPLHKPHNIGP